MSRLLKRRRYQLASLGCWVIALSVWIAQLVGGSSKLLIAIALAATISALGFTIAAAANS